MAAAEGKPLDFQARVSELIAQPFRHDIGKDFIMRAVTLKIGNPLRFRSSGLHSCFASNVPESWISPA